jgi:superfamily II DNA helicase RecQ
MQDLRLSIHPGLQSNLGAYLQERGRVNRDGRGGASIIILSKSSIMTRLKQTTRNDLRNGNSELEGFHTSSFLDMVYSLTSPDCFMQALAASIDVPVEQIECLS